MENIWDIYKSKTWVEPFLIYCIAGFILVAVVMFFLTIISRMNKKKEAKLKAENDIIIEKLLSVIMFTDKTYFDIAEDKDYISFFKHKLCREHLMRSVINLHKNYSGKEAKRLELFYFESNLISDSFDKLKHRKWEVKCLGINELAEMNVQRAFPVFVQLSKQRNKILKIRAISACIKLNGTEGITHLVNHRYPIDNWVMINIIHALKNHDADTTKGIELLLTSKNSTVVSLGLKIIQALNLHDKAHHVLELTKTAPNAGIRFEAMNLLQVLTVQNNDYGAI